MKKIFVNKTENLESVVNTVRSILDDEVVLVIPKNALIKNSLNNFHTLRKEAEGAGKSILIESVDDDVLALSASAGIEAIHPFLHRSGTKSHSLSDIVPASQSVSISPNKNQSVEQQQKKEVRQADSGVTVASSAVPVQQQRPPVEVQVVSSQPVHETVRSAATVSDDGSSGRRRLPRLIAGFSVFLVLILALGWAYGAYMGTAKITIKFSPQTWASEQSVAASQSEGQINFEGKRIPAQLFSQDKNFTQAFPATGSSDNPQKASGKIVIINEFGTQSQSLVATTRFATPDGKILRLVKNVTVPGGVMKSGKLTPGSIEAEVTADQPGPDYNIAPEVRLTIPGFEGTPKHKGFYGVSKGVSGGATGKHAVATDKDVEDAKLKTEEILKSGLQNSFLLDRPEGVIIPEGGSQIKVAKLSVNKTVDAEGNFTVFGEGQFQAVGIKEGDLKELFLKQAIAEVAGAEAGRQLEFKDWNVAYSDVKPDFENGVVTFGVKISATLVPVFSPESFRETILGKDIREVKTMMGQIPYLEDAKLSLKPFWIKALPSSAGRVEIVVE